MIKKILWFFIFLFCMISANMAFAANKYARAAGGNWNTDATWSTTSGGAADTTKPTLGDAAILDANSGNVTVDVDSACDLINCTGYTGTLTLGANLTVDGSLTFVAGMTFTPSTYLVTLDETGTITTAGKAFYDLTIEGENGDTVTLADDITVNNDLIIGGNGGPVTINGNTIHVKVDLTGNAANGGNLGTTTISIDGSSDQNISLTTADDTKFYRNPLVIASTGGTVYWTNAIHKVGGNLTKTAGTVDFTTNTSTIRFLSASTKSVDAFTFYNLDVHGSGTYTLNGDLTVNNTLTLGGSGGVVTVNGNNIVAKGTVNGDATKGGTTGTTVIKIGGSGNQTVNLVTLNDTFMYTNIVNIASTGGTVSFANAIHKLGKGLTYTSGTVDLTTNTSTIRFLGATARNVASFTYYNLDIAGASTYTLDGDVTVNNTCKIGAGTITLNGNNLYLKGDFTYYVAAHWDILGTTNISMIGTGTQALELNFLSTAKSLQNNFTIAGSGTVNMAGTMNYSVGTWTYTSSTVNPGTSLFQTTGNCTITSNGMSFYDFSVINGTTTLGNALDVNRNLLITATKTLAAAGFDINVGGNWTGNGTFTHGNNEVIFDTVANTSVISGTTTFYDLTCNTASKAIEVAASTTQTIAHTLTLNGQANGTKITLDINGGTPGVDRFTFDVTGGAQAVQYVDVADSNASTNNIVATYSKNSGNTDSAEAAPHWVISGGGQFISVN